MTELLPFSNMDFKLTVINMSKKIIRIILPEDSKLWKNQLDILFQTNAITEIKNSVYGNS